jgi:hypothetical protein
MCVAMQRVSKLPYVPEDADVFERAWLALADIHVAGGKFDLAQVREGPDVQQAPHATQLHRTVPALGSHYYAMHGYKKMHANAVNAGNGTC